MNELFAIILTLLSIINTTPKDFTSVGELQLFLQEDTSDKTVYLTPDKNGVVSFNGVCEHRAFKLRDNAYKKGYWLETEYMTYAETVKKFPKATTAHMLNKAVVGNDVYYVEPSTDEIWLAYGLD